MFIGHFALGLAAKRATPRVSLAVLFAAAQLADLLWPVFLAIGLEQVRIDPGNTAVTPLDFVSYPFSHSLLMLVLWGILLAALCRPFARGRRAFVVISALVVSHWLLDFVTHRPDMPLYPGDPLTPGEIEALLAAVPGINHYFLVSSPEGCTSVTVGDDEAAVGQGR